MRNAIGRLGAILRDDRGVVFPITLVFSLVVTISGIAFLSLSVSGSTMLKRSTNQAKVLYLTEGAVRKTLWKLERCPIGEWETYGNFSDSTEVGVVDVTYDGTTNMLACNGTVSEASKQIRVFVDLDVPMEHVITYTADLQQNGTSGDVTHDDSSPPAFFDVLPAVDFTYYEGIADTIYNPPTGKQTFNDSLSPGIHYVNGDVDVKTETILDGTIVATGAIRFFGSGEIFAQPVPGDTLSPPTHYPAILSAANGESDMLGGSPGLTIHGMIYSRGNVDLNPCNVNGPILGSNVVLSGSYDVAYDPKYGRTPPGFSFPVGSFKTEATGWSED